MTAPSLRLQVTAGRRGLASRCEAPPAAIAPFVLREHAPGAIDAADWDRFVVACGGSFLGSAKVIRAERFLHRVRVFEVQVASSAGVETIGRCAVAVAGRRARFLDRLHLLPRYTDRWAEAVQQILACCGAGSFVYGSAWNHERRSAAEVAHIIPGSRLVDRPLRIDGVDFSAWRDFADYRRSVSENLRRDYRKAAAAGPVVVVRHGLGACRDVARLVGLRAQVLRRNGEPFSSVADARRHVLKLLCMGDDAFIATVEAFGRRQAAFFGVRFGGAIYYLGGGTEDRSHGFGSYLFLTLIERWFAECPNGTLHLGSEPADIDAGSYTQGNLLYRRKLRAGWVPGTSFCVQPD